MRNSFPNFEPVGYSTSSSNCCFLSCIQFSHEIGKVVCCSYFFKNFPQFLLIQIQGFSIINEAEIDVFLEFPCFFPDPTYVGNLTSGSWKFSVHIPLKPSLKDFEYILASMWNESNCTLVGTFSGIAPLWDWNESWSFTVLWPLLSFSNLLTYWVQHYHNIIF